MPQDNQNEIQKELEKLAWEFITELNDSGEKDKEETDFLIEEAEEQKKGQEIAGQVEGSIDDGIQSLYTKNDYGLNDIGRESGIIMDEDTLEDYKVTEWHKPPKLRQTFYEKAWWFLVRVIGWPFRMIFKFLYLFFILIYKIMRRTYRLSHGLISFSWDFIKAFKYAGIYLFGDFSWLANRKRQIKENSAILADEKSELKQKIGSLKISWRRAVVLAVFLLLLILPFKFYSSYYQFKEIKGKVLGVSQVGLSHFQQAGVAGEELNFKKADKEFILAAANFNQAARAINSLGPLANQAIKLSPNAIAAKRLIEAARLASEAGRHLMRAANFLDSYNLNLAVNDKTKVKINNSLKTDSEKNRENLLKAAGDVKTAYEQAAAAAAILDKTDLSATQFDNYRQTINNFKNNLPVLLGWLKQGNDTAQVLVQLLGLNEPKRWMLVFQNNTELRPSGGFMGSYAIVDMQNGQIKKIDVPGGGFYDLKGSLAVKIDAPYPFHLFSPIWQPWNANWFYDWPTSARKIEWFYDKSGGPTVDGVIAFTPDVLINILKVVGEIDMPDYNLKITADNFIRVLQTQVEFGYDKQENKPKKVIADLLPKVLDRLSRLDKDELLKLWGLIDNNLKQKQILVYFNEPTLEDRIKALGWAGQVLATKGDYLAIINTNVAGGKTDGVVKNIIRHQARVLANGQIIDRVELTRVHQGDKNDVFTGTTNVDYVRFYVPAGSHLLAASGFDGPPQNRVFQWADDLDEDTDLAKVNKTLKIDKRNNNMRISQEFGRTVFANWIIVAPGESRTVSLEYVLPIKFKTSNEFHSQAKELSWWQLIKRYFTAQQPAKIKMPKQNYSLLIQKQPGLSSVDFKSRLILGDNWRIDSYLANKPLISGVDNSVEYEDNLNQDAYYKIILEKK